MSYLHINKLCFPRRYW